MVAFSFQNKVIIREDGKISENFSTGYFDYKVLRFLIELYPM